MAGGFEKFLNFLGISSPGYEDVEDEPPRNNRHRDRISDERDRPEIFDPNERYMTSRDEIEDIFKTNDEHEDFGMETGMKADRRYAVEVLYPEEYEHAQSIIDKLKEKKTLIINLTKAELPDAQRILDFISGAVYALNGNIRKAGVSIFAVTPNNVELITNEPDSNGQEYEFSSFGDRG